MFRGHAAAVVLRRLPRLLLGLFLMATGISAMVRAELGLSPWDVLHQGISLHTGIPIGTVTILAGLVVMLAWIPLRERVGVGTVVNVILIGVLVDVELAARADGPHQPRAALGPRAPRAARHRPGLRLLHRHRPRSGPRGTAS